MAEQFGDSQRILVVDGEVLVRHVIADYLRTCGYVVIEAANTDEAKVVLGDGAVHVSTVLCDADAPGSQSAFELRGWARDRFGALKIILAGDVAGAARKAAELC